MTDQPDITHARVCARCKTEKTIDQFYKDARGWSYWCKECCREREREYRKTEEYRAYCLSRRVCHTGPNETRQRLSKIELLAAETWQNVRRRCFRNGKVFDLNCDFVTTLFQQFCQTHYHSLGGRDPFQPSLDRIDSTRSYTKDNVRVVWLIENYARNNFSDDDVIRFCKLKLGLE